MFNGSLPISPHRLELMITSFQMVPKVSDVRGVLLKFVIFFFGDKNSLDIGV